jgi:hypothetical protein
MNSHAGSSLPWGDIKRIVVLRTLYLGDMLCAVPALRALKRAAPRASVTLVGLQWAREFCSRYRRYVDQFIAFPGFPGLPAQPLEAGAIAGFLGRFNINRFVNDWQRAFADVALMTAPRPAPRIHQRELAR